VVLYSFFIGQSNGSGKSGQDGVVHDEDMKCQSGCGYTKRSADHGAEAFEHSRRYQSEWSIGVLDLEAVPSCRRGATPGLVARFARLPSLRKSSWLRSLPHGAASSLLYVRPWLLQHRRMSLSTRTAAGKCTASVPALGHECKVSGSEGHRFSCAANIHAFMFLVDKNRNRQRRCCERRSMRYGTDRSWVSLARVLDVMAGSRGKGEMSLGSRK